MAAIDFFGYLFLALGPGAAFFGVFIAPKSFVVLLSIFSAFLWLVVLLFTSAIFRGFVPLSPTVETYTGVVLAAVAIEEAVRYIVWHFHFRLCQVLEAMARRSGHGFSYSDHLYLALGWGTGHAACHALFFFASLLPLTTGDGSYYSEACPAMSLFLVSALNCLGTSATLVAAMVVALDGWHRGRATHVLYAPAVHLATGLLTLGNFKAGGCTYSVPAVLALGAANTLYAVQMAWRSVPPAARTPGSAVVPSIRRSS